MKIQEVLRECVVALFSSPDVGPHLFLKGGAALQIAEEMDFRLSTDIDLSTPNKIENPSAFFAAIGEVLAGRFRQLGYLVIDPVYVKKPRNPKPGFPEDWGGWLFTFKLVPIALVAESIEIQRRNALMPSGSARTTLELEVSEWEYCGEAEIIQLGTSQVRVYSNTLLILEKLRAICQQHHAYPFSGLKGRSRDFFDIHNLVKKHGRSDGFHAKLKQDLPKVFEAKQVPLDLLDAIFEDEFLAVQQSDFLRLADTLKTEPEPFDFYVDRLRILVEEIRPPRSMP